MRELHPLPEFRLRNSIPALAPEFELRLRNSFISGPGLVFSGWAVGKPVMCAGLGSKDDRLRKLP
ncbi:hypothetical protein AB0D58_32275, partial [Streptomyces sp. NPDC048210]|uniref:hypothetical protein n=1 Tax=Streptomyces sp. NPDC048210 TaxID=3156657 RepID=UPI00344A2BE6